MQSNRVAAAGMGFATALAALCGASHALAQVPISGFPVLTTPNVPVIIATTPITGGNNTYLLFNNNGVLGNEAVSSLSISGTQLVVGTVPNAALVNPLMMIGGQIINLGGSTTNQGNGEKLQLSTGIVTPSNCVKFDANGNTVDAGAGCIITSGGTMTGTLTMNGSGFNQLTTGVPYDGSSDPLIGGLTSNAILQRFTAGDLSVNPGGYYGMLCIATILTNSGGNCIEVEVQNSSVSGWGYAISGLAVQATPTALSTFGLQGIGIQHSAHTAGEVNAGYFGIESHGTGGGAGIEISHQGSANSTSAIYMQTDDPSTGFNVGLNFHANANGTPMKTAYIADFGDPAVDTFAASLPYGMNYRFTSFTTAEYDGPSFQIGPTVGSYNSKVAITGSSSGNPSIAPVGAGTSPATNATLNVSGLGTGFVKLNSVAQLKVLTVATLPTCNAAAKGALASVSDANTPAWNATVAGGGSTYVLVSCNGTNWTVH